MPKDDDDFVPNPDQPVHQGKVSFLFVYVVEDGSVGLFPLLGW